MQLEGPAWWGVLVVVGGLLLGLLASTGTVLAIPTLIALVAVVLSVRHPALILLAVYFSLLMENVASTGVIFAGLPLTTSKLTVLAAIGVFSLNAALTGRPLVRWTPVTAGLLAMLGSMLLSLAGSLYPRAALTDMAGLVMLSAMLHLVAQALRPEDFKVVFRVMTLALLVVMVTALVQTPHETIEGIESTWRYRSVGTLLDPNEWATVVVMVGSLLIGFLVEDKHPLSRALLFALATMMPVAVVQSLSRAGLLSFLLVLPGLIWLLRKQWRLLLPAGLTGAAIAAATIDFHSVLLRARSLLDPSVESSLGNASLSQRRDLMFMAMDLFKEHWLTGVGVGMFKHYSGILNPGGESLVAHNTYLNAAAEQGIVGLITHGLTGVLLLYMGYRLARHGPTAFYRSAGMGFLLSMIGFGAMAATLNLVTFSIAYFVIGVGVALHFSAEQPEAYRAEPPVAATAD